MTTPSEALRLNGLDALFHGHPDGVCVVDVDGVFVESNSTLADLTGYRAADLLGMPFSRLLHPDYVESTMARFVEAVAGENRRYVTRIVTPDGTVRLLDVTLIPLRGDDAEVPAVLAIARDIGDVERAAAAARDADDRRAEPVGSRLRALREDSDLGPGRISSRVARSEQSALRRESIEEEEDLGMRELFDAVEALRWHVRPEFDDRRLSAPEVVADIRSSAAHVADRLDLDGHGCSPDGGSRN